MKAERTTWKIASEETVYKADPFLRVTRQHVLTDTGQDVRDYFQVILPNYVVAVALTPKKRVITLWQYKHGAREYGLTFPAGVIDQDESAEQALHRELLEETGYVAAETRFLGRFATSGNQQCGFGSFFLLTGCERVGDPAAGDLETMAIRLMGIDQVEAAVQGGAAKVLPHVTVWGLSRPYLDTSGC